MTYILYSYKVQVHIKVIDSNIKNYINDFFYIGAIYIYIYIYIYVCVCMMVLRICWSDRKYCLCLKEYKGKGVIIEKAQQHISMYMLACVGG